MDLELKIVHKLLANKLSIQTRENIVLPLITIQQYALQNIKEIEKNKSNNRIEIFEKMITRSLFGNINEKIKE